MTMIPDEIRIAVAELCGWRFHLDGSGFIPPGGSDWIGRGYKPLHEVCPNYPEDLNACHEMERTLTPEQEEKYVYFLGSLLMQAAYEDDPRSVNSNLSSSDSTYRATALQRCEAFLRLHGKWRG